ncbi:MAG TPA: hypothetical protein VF032_10780 [Thermoleophilaceae bacterium]
MSLHRLTVYYETDSNEDLEKLQAAIERAICPTPAFEPHDCPHRWMLITSELDAAEAAELDELLNS